MIKNQKGFTNFLLILILLIGIGGLVYYSWQKGLIRTTPSQESSPTPTSDPTAGWQTYNNSTYAYSFKIPPAWESFRQTGDDSIMTLRPKGVTEIPITITVQVNSSKNTADEITDNQVGKNYPRKTVMIDEIEWTYYDSEVSPYNSRVYLSVHDNYYYQLGVSTLNKEYLKVFAQILSTFKFNSK